MTHRARGAGAHGDVAAADDSGRRCLNLDDRADAARAGRRFVQEQLLARGAAAFADDAALVAAELLANAHQHGEPPIIVCVDGDEQRIRVEIHDASLRAPVRPTQSTTNMTGRGIALVEALSDRWGIDRPDSGGKVIWAEFAAHVPASEQAEFDPLLGWHDDAPRAQERFTVVLGNVPTDFLIQAKAHIDNVVRELSLARAASETLNLEIPEHLARLMETVVYGFRDARDAIKRQALAAAKRGDPLTVLTLHLPASAADAGEAYLAALDEADEYSRAARLLTLETPPDHRLFRHWYVEAVIQQLRRLASGLPALPVKSFEDVLVAEIRRLSSAQRVSERAARLQRVTAALATASTPEDVAQVVVSEGVEALASSGGSVLVPAGDGEHLAVPSSVGYNEELIGALREERLDAPLPAATALRTATPVWLESQQERDEQFPALRGFEAATVAMCAVPLIVGSRCIGALRFSFSGRKLFDDDERSFVLALAALTAQTLQRTEVHEAERKAALDFQRALLSVEPPVIAGWSIATYYSPAGDEEVGGDFYDVLPTPDGRVVAFVGDVMGRGLGAAAAMAEVRSTIRAYALDDPDPVCVFSRVDTYFEALAVEQLVTVLYFLIDPKANTAQIASAGHLPPLLVKAEGTHILQTPTGTPFGVNGVPRTFVTVQVPEASSIVAVTDGLVERRGEDIEEGVDRLIAATEGTAGWPAEQLLSHITRAAAADRVHDDDVTMLVLRRS